VALTFRSARPEEADALTELVLRSKAHWGYSEEFMAGCREELTIHPEQVATKRTTVAVLGERAVAVAQLAGEPPRGELDMLFVDPDVIGRGFGGKLFRHMAESARRCGFESLELTADPFAEPFYEAMGAVRVGSEASGSIPGRVLNRYAYRL
jgi:GNAT superfamily N-acetyltransferase